MSKIKKTQNRITKEVWKIFEYFVEGQSKQIEKYLISKRCKSKTESLYFKAYPGKIERDGIGVNRVTAGKACKLFCDLEILEELDKESGDHLKGASAVPYKLRSDVRTFRIILNLLFKGSSEVAYFDEPLQYPEIIKLLDNYYFTYNINDALVKEVLAENNVTITRYFSTLDFDVKCAQRLIDLDEKNYSASENKTDATEMMTLIVTSYEEEAKRIERSHMNNLAEFCSGFLEMINDPPVSIESRLQDYENWAFRLIERFDDYKIYRSQYFSSPLENIRLELPIFCDNIPKKEKTNCIKEDNFSTFYYLLYGEGVIDFSDILEDALIANEKIVDELKTIEQFLRLPDNHLSDNYSAELNQFKDKWKNQINNNENKYNPKISTKLLEDIRAIYSILPDSLEKLLEKYDRDYDLESMIRNIERRYDTIEKEVLKHSEIKDLKSEFIENNFDTVLNEHYTKYEYQKVIVPILSLIHTSPLALNEFLNGKWDSFGFLFDREGKLEHNQFFTKLIHIASVNLLLFPNVLKNGIIESAGMESTTYPDHRQMLSTYRSNLDIQDYNQMYHSLSKDWYNGMDFTEFRSIEPTFLKIKLKQLFEIRYKLRFQAEYNSEANTTIDSRAEVKIRSELESLEIEHIKAPIAIILKLRLNNGKYAHIRNMFSTKMQNKILFVNVDERPSMSFVKELLAELNAVIMDPKFYEDGLFDDVLPQKEGNKLALKTHLDQKLSNIEIMRMVNEKPLYHGCFLGDNRYLLERSFEKEIESGCSWSDEPNYPDYFEKYLDRCAEINQKRSEIKKKDIV